MFNRILVLCTGNICRSPVAEAMLQAGLPGKKVESAGLGALVDHPADSIAQELATQAGLDIGQHRARQATTEMFRRADLILVMSWGQKAQVTELDPSSNGKTLLISRWLDDQPDIPDPYKKSREAFVHVHKRLEEAVYAWLLRL
ncbi:low molecular weight protein-tyrosine-phosphatase [Marinobacter sp. chi1]|uniref:protein-tyrosine-phosphatase n=1 Tax=Marinobacter suaedae TaxID=3057675 RepID=A0ABT8VWH1_9GAMM|nr:low molecular weight protein-tyrosine-phosphatase [Marinobacter sp. chi1]MDO3720332.1 low molecular weight protein-tyrosine-phosphatase [Marinobacter sp. chi1]